MRCRFKNSKDCPNKKRCKPHHKFYQKQTRITRKDQEFDVNDRL